MKRVIILEGQDACGKTTLLKHLQDKTNGKCHTFHSNFDKSLPKENHRKQHKLIAEFIKEQFDDEHYTGNHTVILDRCYISDMTYGQLGYGSRGNIEQKYDYLRKLFKTMSNNGQVDIILIYCRPSQTEFDIDAKEELLTDNENDKMQDIYDSVMFSLDMTELLVMYDINFYVYNFNNDSDYKHLDNYIDTIDLVKRSGII